MIYGGFYNTSTAEFRRKRRPSRKFRKAMRDLGRKRQGKSRDRWKGIALAGGAVIGAGAVATALKRRKPTISTTLPDVQSSDVSGSSIPPRSPAALPQVSPPDFYKRQVKRSSPELSSQLGDFPPELVEPLRQSVRSREKKYANKNKVKKRVGLMQHRARGEDRRIRAKTRSTGTPMGMALTDGAFNRIFGHRTKATSAVKRQKRLENKEYVDKEIKEGRYSRHSFCPTANFRRPRRASLAQRRVAQDLGRRRRGLSPSQWAGIRGLGTTVAGVGALTVGGHALLKRINKKHPMTEGQQLGASMGITLGAMGLLGAAQGASLRRPKRRRSSQARSRYPPPDIPRFSRLSRYPRKVHP